MFHWGKSLLFPLLLTREVLSDFMPNWGNLEMFFFFIYLFFILLFMTKLYVV